MRVIAGSARGLCLQAPKGMHTRPTTDRLKETLFNILSPALLDCVFLDLFSGSGGIGIEALSRGAKKAYFVDNDAAAAACIKGNLQAAHLTQRGVVLKKDIFAALPLIQEEAADIVFADPPYAQGYEERLFDAFWKLPYITDNTKIIIEAALATDFSFVQALGFAVYREKNYKTNKHVFIQRERAQTL